MRLRLIATLMVSLLPISLAGESKYADLCSTDQLEVAQSLDHIVATAPRTAEIIGFTQSGKAFVQIEDDMNTTLAYATFDVNQKWESFLVWHAQELSGDATGQVKRSELDQLERCPDPELTSYFAPVADEFSPLDHSHALDKRLTHCGRYCSYSGQPGACQAVCTKCSARAGNSPAWSKRCVLNWASKRNTWCEATNNQGDGCNGL